LTKEEFEEAVSEVRENCPKFKHVADDRDGEITCLNSYYHSDEHEFYIKEVEVIE
jgi:hypothetical protein